VNLLKISKLNPSYSTEKIHELLKDENEIFNSFQKAESAEGDFVYIAENDQTIQGILIIQRINRLSAKIVLFVDEHMRNNGIGTKLLETSDQIIQTTPYEFTVCEFKLNDNTADFLEKRGYIRSFKEVNMERDNTLISPEKINDMALAQKGIVIRNYKNEDYWANHNIVSVGFYLMRKKACAIQWYDQPSEYEREFLSRDYNCSCRYVLVVNGEIVGVGKIFGNYIALLGVRPDKQHQGYGTLMLSYFINKIIGEQHPDKVTISVLEKNPAKMLYLKMGFREIGYKYNYVKFHKPDSRPQNPVGYLSEKEIMDSLCAYGELQEEMVP
jgi:GNAT superfamily N-acetyltransferase